MKIAVAGTGYVGLSIATLLAQHNEVVAVDVVPEKVTAINNRKSPIRDEYIEKFFAQEALNLRATLDAEEAYREAELVVVAVLPAQFGGDNGVINVKVAVLPLVLLDLCNKLVKLCLKCCIGALLEDIRRALHPFGNVAIPKDMRFNFQIFIKFECTYSARVVKTVIYRFGSNVSYKVLSFFPKSTCDFDIIKFYFVHNLLLDN